MGQASKGAKKTKRNYVAYLLGIFIPGLDHIYYGERKRGLWVMGVGFAISVLMALILPYYFAICIALAYRLWQAYDLKAIIPHS